MTTPTIIRLFGTAPDSIVDGPGLRFAVFVQGCTHGCPGCHNPESQPRAGGEVRAIDDLVAHIAANKLAQGVTISGGEPFEQAAACAELARRCRALGLNVWTYSGYTYEQLAAGVPDPAARDLLAQTDVLVDGPFVQAKHSFDLKWRGCPPRSGRAASCSGSRARSCRRSPLPGKRFILSSLLHNRPIM